MAHLHNVNYISPRTGRIVMLPTLRRPNGVAIASFPRFLNPGILLTLEVAQSIVARKS